MSGYNKKHLSELGDIPTTRYINFLLMRLNNFLFDKHLFLWNHYKEQRLFLVRKKYGIYLQNILYCPSTIFHKNVKFFNHGFH